MKVYCRLLLVVVSQLLFTSLWCLLLSGLLATTRSIHPSNPIIAVDQRSASMQLAIQLCNLISLYSLIKTNQCRLRIFWMITNVGQHGCCFHHSHFPKWDKGRCCGRLCCFLAVYRGSEGFTKEQVQWCFSLAVNYRGGATWLFGCS